MALRGLVPPFPKWGHERTQAAEPCAGTHPSGHRRALQSRMSPGVGKNG